MAHAPGGNLEPRIFQKSQNLLKQSHCPPRVKCLTVHSLVSLGLDLRSWCPGALLIPLTPCIQEALASWPTSVQTWTALGLFPCLSTITLFLGREEGPSTVSAESPTCCPSCSKGHLVDFLSPSLGSQPGKRQECAHGSSFKTRLGCSRWGDLGLSVSQTPPTLLRPGVLQDH